MHSGIFRIAFANFGAKIERDSDRGYSRARLYIKSINELRVRRIYLHFGARDATRLPALFVARLASGRGLYAPRAITDVISD